MRLPRRFSEARRKLSDCRASIRSAGGAPDLRLEPARTGPAPHCVGLYVKSAALIVLFSSLVRPVEGEELLQSRPMRMNDAEFAIAAPEKWVPDQAVQLELRIKNLSAAKTMFPLVNTMKLELSDSRGMTLGLSNNRQSTKPVAPLILKPGETGSHILKSSVAKDGDAVRLSVDDGTGCTYLSRPIKPANVRLSLTYSNKIQSRSADSKAWTGEAITEDLEIKLSDGSTPPPNAVSPDASDAETPSLLPGP